jgi:hypothetical protein
VAPRSLSRAWYLPSESERLMRKLLLSISAFALFAFACRLTAQDTTTAPAPAPQYYTLSLPAGVNLISSPLDTGPGLGLDVFQGLPSQDPLFFGWESNSQAWISSAEAPAGLAQGFWVYLPTPTILVVAGQPFSPFISVNVHLSPGWHLFGVPFEEGVGWKDFKLYASGNPISLDTAINIGWIDSPVTTMQGSEVQQQTVGQPLLPGDAYWVHTSVPLQLRADRQPDVTPSTGTSLPGLSPMVRKPSPSSSGDTTATTVMGWLSEVAKFLGDVAEGALAATEGNWAAASFDWAGGAFGMIEYGLTPGAPDTSSQLTTMEGQLDNLIGSVDQIKSTLTNMDNQITGLTNYIYLTNDLGANLSDAESWLQLYYTDQTLTLQSRNWARWFLAGCIPQGADPVYPGSCSEANNPVTQANTSLFQKNFITNPGFTNLPQGQLTVAADDFPLWWAYAVLGNLSLVPAYEVNGTKASAFVTEIHTGLTNNAPGGNALMAYMRWVFSGDSNCNSDVSSTTCDLYNDVYKPTEAYFLQVLGDQAQLAEAVVEADNVLAEKFPNQATYANAASLYMDGPGGINQQVNEEVEAFLEVAEQLALYRAADGTQDWNTFGSSDAGQLLARADFEAAQLGRQPNASNPNLAPPWPTSGVVGRVFYTTNEPTLSASQTRGVCLYVSVNQANCTNPVGQISENTTSARTLTGDWPYLLWSTSTSGKTTSATGTPNTQWKVQRLVPLNLPVEGPDALTYVVNSTVPTRLGNNLVVATYDPTTYTSEANGTAGGIVFGSLNGIEGPIGKYGLPLTESLWTTSGPAISHKGGTPPKSVFDFTYLPVAPGAGSVSVTYTPIPDVETGEHASSVQESWSASANIKVAANSSFPNQHMHWPSALNVNLTGGVIDTYDGDGVVIGGGQYYSSAIFDQQVISNGKTVGDSASPANPVSGENSLCPSSPFNTCTISDLQSVDVGGLPVATNYTFTASFSSVVLPYSQSAFTGNFTIRSSNAGSTATWVINAPMITLTK